MQPGPNTVQEAKPATRSRPRVRQRIVVLVICAAAGPIVWFLIRSGWLTTLRSLLDLLVVQIAQLGPWAPILFVLLYIASCVAMLPAAVLTLAAGAVFGFVEGSILVSIGATLGAGGAFLVSRRLGRNWVERRLSAHPVFLAIDRAVSTDGWKIVLLTRLTPVLPFFVLNYLYGVTRVPFVHFLGATWLGIIPGSTLLVYLGSLTQPGDAASVWVWTMRIAGLLATLGTTVYLTRIAKRALSGRLGSSELTRPFGTA